MKPRAPEVRARPPGRPAAMPIPYAPPLPKKRRAGGRFQIKEDEESACGCEAEGESGRRQTEGIGRDGHRHGRDEGEPSRQPILSVDDVHCIRARHTEDEPGDDRKDVPAAQGPADAGRRSLRPPRSSRSRGQGGRGLASSMPSRSPPRGRRPVGEPADRPSVEAESHERGDDRRRDRRARTPGPSGSSARRAVGRSTRPVDAARRRTASGMSSEAHETVRWLRTFDLVDVAGGTVVERDLTAELEAEATHHEVHRRDCRDPRSPSPSGRLALRDPRCKPRHSSAPSPGGMRRRDADEGQLGIRQTGRLLGIRERLEHAAERPAPEESSERPTMAATTPRRRRNRRRNASHRRHRGGVAHDRRRRVPRRGPRSPGLAPAP